MKNGKILIIDDNEDVLFALNLLLEPYVEQIKVTTQPERIEHFMSTFVPDVILLDMNFRRDAISGQEGFFWLEKIKAADPDAVVLFITAYADTEKAVRAIKAGATDFIPKPWEKEKLLATLSAALKLRESRTEINTLKQRVEALGSPDDTGFEIIGESDVMQELFATIAKLKDTDANILILGENGTGKDLIARALYHHSPRCNQVFISIDLGSIPEQLFESELFGYETGAFTGANKSGNPGKFELADGGTLFLDEIGDMPLDVQATLLRVIQNKEIIRIGGKKPKSIDVRIIAATNSDLETAVENKLFRSDLYYRLNVLSIKIPPLRQRLEDVPALMDYFVRLHGSEENLAMFTPEIRHIFETHSYPGNVRELENMVERVLIAADDDTLHIYDLLDFRTLDLKPAHDNSVPRMIPDTPAQVSDQTDFPDTSPGTFDTINSPAREYSRIVEALKQEKGHVPSAAIRLDMPKRTLYRKIQKYNIELESFRQW